MTFLSVQETLSRIFRVLTPPSLWRRLLAFALLFFWGPLLIGSVYGRPAAAAASRARRCGAAAARVDAVRHAADARHPRRPRDALLARLAGPHQAAPRLRRQPRRDGRARAAQGRLPRLRRLVHRGAARGLRHARHRPLLPGLGADRLDHPAGGRGGRRLPRAARRARPAPVGGDAARPLDGDRRPRRCSPGASARGARRCTRSRRPSASVSTALRLRFLLAPLVERGWVEPPLAPHHGYRLALPPDRLRDDASCSPPTRRSTPPGRLGDPAGARSPACRRSSSAPGRRGSTTSPSPISSARRGKPTPSAGRSPSPRSTTSA